MSGRLQSAVLAAIAICTLLLCWHGVSWAFRPGLFLWADEIGNLPGLLDTPYRVILHLLPLQVYNDRPTGEALERILFELFGFDYRRQLACFLCFHFANCVLIFLLFRRLCVGTAISLAGTALFGTLCTTAMTATYIGASFDVLCTTFLLGSILTVFGAGRWQWYASALLFLLALRSKEFAIVLPVLLTALLAGRGTVWRRLWPHYAILAIFGIRYLYLWPRMRAAVPPQSPYYLEASLGTILKSFYHYTALIFTLEDRGIVTTLFLAALALLFVYAAVIRKRRWILFGLGAYGLTLLPVAMLPNIRQPLYVYGPQIFLILAICVSLDSLLQGRWVATSCIAAALLAGAYAIRTSGYSRSRISFCLAVRATCARTAHDAGAKLSGIAKGAHLYISSGASSPWLMLAGPCDYMKLLRHDRTISCILMKPEQHLLDLYARDRTPEKYFIDYHDTGSLQIRASHEPTKPPATSH